MLDLLQKLPNHTREVAYEFTTPHNPSPGIANRTPSLIHTRDCLYIETNLVSTHFVYCPIYKLGFLVAFHPEDGCSNTAVSRAVRALFNHNHASKCVFTNPSKVHYYFYDQATLELAKSIIKVGIFELAVIKPISQMPKVHVPKKYFEMHCRALGFITENLTPCRIRIRRQRTTGSLDATSNHDYLNLNLINHYLKELEGQK